MKTSPVVKDLLRRCIFLMHDEDCAECLELVQLMDLLGLSYSRVPCSGMWEAKMVLGVVTLEGMKQIRRVVLEGRLKKLLDGE